MNPLPVEIEKEGWLAYEQARAFENLRRKRVPEIYAGLFVVVMIATLLTALTHPKSLLAVGGFGAAAIYAVVGWLKWSSLRMRHAHNVRRLAELEAKYGMNLPWTEVERHLAALAELRSELGREKEGKT
jgi:hypothetical protein